MSPLRLPAALPCCTVLLVFCAPLANAGVVHCFSKDAGLFGSLSQYDDAISDGLQSIICGPVSAVNSFAYLQRAYPDIYKGALISDADKNGQYDSAELAAVAIELAKEMKTEETDSTWPDMFIYGKWQYSEQKAAGKTRYAAQLSDYYTWGAATDARPAEYAPPAPKPDWVQADTSPQWNFLFDNLKACEDVELLISWSTFGSSSGHYVTLTSLCWHDLNKDGVLNDPEPFEDTNKNGTWDSGEPFTDLNDNGSWDEDGAFMKYIDPTAGGEGRAQLWQTSKGGLLRCDYQPNARITMAMKQSPVPEPSTLLTLFTLAVVGGWFLRPCRRER